MDKTEPNFNFSLLAQSTANFSFRDLKNLCKQAKSKRIPPQISVYVNENDEKKIDLPVLKSSDFNEILSSGEFSYLTRYQ